MQDLANFRQLLREEQRRGGVLEAAWRGVLAGTHAATLAHKTQLLASGAALLHISAATIRETGAAHSTCNTSARTLHCGILLG